MRTRPSCAFSAAAADFDFNFNFNKGGRPDLAVARFNTGGLDVLLGTGQ